MDAWHNKPNYSPTFLDDEECLDSSDPTRSVHKPKSKSDVSFSLEDFLGYPSAVDDLRIISPYKHELKSALGNDIFALTSKGGFDIDVIPDEWVSKYSSMLLKIKPNGFSGYSVIGDKKTIYFTNEQQARSFIDQLNQCMSPSFEEQKDHHDRLNNLLRSK